jgi:hypothetical protein
MFIPHGMIAFDFPYVHVYLPELGGFLTRLQRPFVTTYLEIVSGEPPGIWVGLVGKTIYEIRNL